MHTSFRSPVRRSTAMIAGAIMTFAAVGAEVAHAQVTGGGGAGRGAGGGRGGDSTAAAGRQGGQGRQGGGRTGGPPAIPRGVLGGLPMTAADSAVKAVVDR